MSAPTFHEQLTLKNFTAFQEASFSFVPGINAFVGENGTGKTHVMKVLYAAQRSLARGEGFFYGTLLDLFQAKSTGDFFRLGASRSQSTIVEGSYDGQEWDYSLFRTGLIGSQLENTVSRAERPVFIPAIDMMGHSKGFTEAYEEVRLDFDSTCRDIVNLLRLERRNGTVTENSDTLPQPSPLAEALGGEVERDDDGRFYLATPQGRLAMPMVAEGLRKIATLVQLERNGWLRPGTTLFWDEPEVNLNPVLMDEVVGALLALSRRGVQVFIATHSYVILKELDLQAKSTDSVRYFAFEKSVEGTQINATEEFSQIQPNLILEQYSSLYDRELTRATGRNNKGERVR